uniref:hypothetical protein n=1 Tax=Serratia quinivorans TaxID=137545 RepID=UPI0035C711AD
SSLFFDLINISEKFLLLWNNHNFSEFYVRPCSFVLSLWVIESWVVEFTIVVFLIHSLLGSLSDLDEVSQVLAVHEVLV